MKRFIGPSPRAKKKEVNGADRDPIRTWLAGAIRLHGSFTPSVEGQALGGQSVTSLLFRPFVGPSVWAVIAIANFGNKIETNAENGNKVVRKRQPEWNFKKHGNEFKCLQ